MGTVRTCLAALAGVLLVGAACSVTPEPSPSPRGLRYIALGDSYTIGTSVSSAESWPSQLVARLGGRLELVANLGVNGYSSADLIAAELPPLDELRPEFVTLQICVNDVVRSVSRATYTANVERILDELLGRLPANRILAVATPDYTLTPMGGSFGNPAQQSAEIAAFNTVLQEAAQARGIAFVLDVFAISRRVASDPSLVASDAPPQRGAVRAVGQRDSTRSRGVAGQLLRRASAISALPLFLQPPNPQSPTSPRGQLGVWNAGLVPLSTLIRGHGQRVVEERPNPSPQPWLGGLIGHTETVPSQGP